MTAPASSPESPPDRQGGPGQPRAAKPKIRVTPAGYFPTYRVDLEKLRSYGEDPTDSGRCITVPVLISVWIALMDLANEARTTTFTASIGTIRHRAGISRNTAFAAVKVIEQLGMASHSQNKSETSKTLSPSTWTVFPSIKRTSATNAPSARRTTPSAADSVTDRRSGNNKGQYQNPPALPEGGFGIDPGGFEEGADPEGQLRTDGALTSESAPPKRGVRERIEAMEPPEKVERAFRYVSFTEVGGVLEMVWVGDGSAESNGRNSINAWLGNPDVLLSLELKEWGWRPVK